MSKEDSLPDKFGILEKTVRNALSIKDDSTIDKNLCVTTGMVDDSMIGTLHDIIRFYCRLIENAKSEILLTTSYWEGKSMSAFMIYRSISSVLLRKPHVKIRIVVDNGNLGNIIQ